MVKSSHKWLKVVVCGKKWFDVVKSGCVWLKVVACSNKWFYVVKRGFMLDKSG